MNYENFEILIESERKTKLHKLGKIVVSINPAHLMCTVAVHQEPNEVLDSPMFEYIRGKHKRARKGSCCNDRYSLM